MTDSSTSGPTGTVFFEGDAVVLVRGPNSGTVGVFLRSRADVKWADITERNGIVRSHPLEWMAHATTGPGDKILYDHRS
jgi:hypothetical protein